MVRTYKKKYKKIEEDSVKEALKKLREGGSFRVVANEYGLPKSTLHLYNTKSRNKKKKLIPARGRKRTLTDDEENFIIDNAKDAGDLGWPVHRDDLARIIGDYCKAIGRKTAFKNGIPGRDFMISFMKRHKNQLSTRRAETLKVARAEAEHPEVISDYIDIIEKAYTMAGINIDNLDDAKRVFNWDETGFKDNNKYKNVLVSRRNYAPGVLTPSEGKANFTVMMCGNAAGCFGPMYVIYKGSETSLPIAWCLNGPPDAVYNTSPSGWMDSDRFKAYIPVFDNFLVKQKIKKPVVVTIDGHGSHIDLEVAHEARKRNIILVKLPPNSTHLLQALDVSVFSPLKGIWNNDTKEWYKQTKLKKITKKVFPPLLAKLDSEMHVGDKGKKNMIAGFRATGIWPLDKKHILDKVEARGVYKLKLDVPETRRTPDTRADGSSAPIDNTRADSTPGGSKGSETIAAPIDNTRADDSSTPGGSKDSETTAATKENLKILSNIVNNVLYPPPDEFTIKALENTKVNTRMSKKFAQIITSDDAIKELEEKKKLSKGKKKTPAKKEYQNEIPMYFSKDTAPREKSKRATRGIKMNYKECLGSSDSEDESNPDSPEDITNLDSLSSSSSPESTHSFFPINTIKNTKTKLIKFWKSISPPCKEADILGKWFGCIYMDSKGKENFYIGRAKNRFLHDEEGKVKEILFECLKPHVGNDNIMEEYPEGQSDLYSCETFNIFDGPLLMNPMSQKRWDVPDLKRVKNLYHNVLSIDRKALYDKEF